MTLDEVFAPYQDEEHGCDWEEVKPEWIEEHGTVVVLLGNKPTDDTVLGDPDRREGGIKGVSTYLNRRLWEIPDRVEVYVDELRTQDRAQWPESADTARRARPTGGAGRRSNMRQIRGARYYIEYAGPATKPGALAHSGTVPLPDGTQVDWYLWKGERPAVQSYAAVGGYIGALYENELYDVTSHQATYRSFGVTERDVRSRLWLIIRPPAYDEQNGKHGVYPRTDRNALLLKGGPGAEGPLPINDWAAQFADRMPAPLLAAIRKARADGHGTITDKTWRERLAERFGTRWQIPKLRVRKDGALTAESIQPGSLPTRIRRVKRLHPITGGGNGGGRRGEPNTGSFPGAKPAVRAKLAGGLPNYRLVGADQVDSGMLAAWHPNDPTEPAGVVLVNIEHPVLEAELEHWQSQYPDHLAEEVGDEVRRVYGEIAVAKVAHSEHLKGVIPSKRVDDDLRSEAALTMALLGLIGEEAVIAPRIGGKFRKRREAA